MNINISQPIPINNLMYNYYKITLFTNIFNKILVKIYIFIFFKYFIL